MHRRNALKIVVKGYSIIEGLIKEGQFRLRPWLVRTSTFMFLLLIGAFIILDIVNPAGFLGATRVRYTILFLFILLFIKKDVNGYWQIKYLEYMNRRLKYINEITETLRSTMEMGKVLQMILENITWDMGFDRAMIFLAERKEHRDFLHGIIGVGIEPDVLNKQWYPLKHDTGIFVRTLLKKKAVIIDASSVDSQYDKSMVDELNLTEFAAIPLEAHDRALGVLVVDNIHQLRKISEEDISLLGIFANQAAIAIENARMYEWTRDRAITDGVTGIYNHRYFQEKLAEELQKSISANRNLSLLFLDLDDFKKYNDTFGHQAGDEVLRRVAEILRTESGATVARYGGEEFAVILPGRTKHAAVETAEKIRNSVERELTLERTGKRQITVSIGVSNFPDTSVKHPWELVEMADKELYRAKQNGKNRVEAA